MRRQCIDHLTAGDARRDGFAVFECGQMFLPIFRQLAAHCLLPELTECRILLFVFADQLFPLIFLLRAAIDCLAKMRHRLIRHVELFVFGPTQMSLGFAHGLFAGRITVGFARAGCGHAVTNCRLDGNQ